MLSALHSRQLDTSDFILLSTRLIEHSTKDSLSNKTLLSKVRQQYLQQNYEGAIETIFELCALEENRSTLGQDVTELTSIKSRLHDEPTNNESRRFYETLYALKLEEQNKKTINYSMFQEFSNLLNELREKPHQLINDFDGALSVITSICALNDNIEMELKKQSPKYGVKDRERNEDEVRVRSSNPGIMKPSSPNFADNLIPSRTVKMIGLDPSIEKGYSRNNPTIPFVTSISGTTFTLVALLEKYIQKHHDDRELGIKVNRIVNLFISTYIIKGYHSYLEIVDVLKEPAIQSIFARNNIQLDYGIIDVPDEFSKAQDYALGLSLKAKLHESIEKIEPHKPSNIKGAIHHPVIKKHQSEEQVKALQEQKSKEQAKALQEQKSKEQAKALEEQQCKEQAKALEDQLIKDQYTKLQKEAKINEILIPINRALDDLTHRIEEVNQHQFRNAYDVALILVDELTAARNCYRDNMVRADLFSDELFKNTCRIAINTARPVLEDALGWGDYLTNLLKALANTVIKVVTLCHRTNFFTPVKSDLEHAVEIAERDLQINNAACHS